jgi:prevent-host-death family protein
MERPQPDLNRCCRRERPMSWTWVSLLDVHEIPLDRMVWSGQTICMKEGSIMKITNISEAKAQLSALIEKVIAGEEVIIGKAGKPVARLIRYERNKQARQPGALQGKIIIADDFDALPEDIAKAFGMEGE